MIQDLFSDHQNNCRKPCTVREYKAEKVVRDFGDKGQDFHCFFFNLRFVLPESTKNQRSLKPMKIVQREYLILTWMSLEGNVGGTLGMFVAFSFLGAMELFITSSSKLFSWMTSLDKCSIDIAFTTHNLKKAVKVILYILLLLGSFDYAWNVYGEYQKGDTSYSVSKEPISLLDLPTVTFCLDFKYSKFSSIIMYGKHFMVDADIFEKDFKTVTLVEDTYIPHLFGLKIRLSKLFQKHHTKVLHYLE